MCCWGKLLSINDTSGKNVGAINPFRYRGYYYDTETGLYYLQSRYYDPNTGRFLNADDETVLGNSKDNPISANLYTYCNNNPVMHSDPNGTWVLDAIFLAADVADFAMHPSVGGAAWVLLDCASFADATGVLAAGGHALKVAHAAEETVHAVDEANHAERIVKAASRIGRVGRQARLRELSKDLKVSKSLRGEIIRDINQIKRKKRRNIRVPSGYELAHRRGYEARKGYGYKWAVLNDKGLHKLQHKYDKYGRRR